MQTAHAIDSPRDIIVIPSLLIGVNALLLIDLSIHVKNRLFRSNYDGTKMSIWKIIFFKYYLFSEVEYIAALHFYNAMDTRKSFNRAL